MSHLSREHELPRSRFEPVVVEPLDGNESNEADVSKELLVMPSLDSEARATTGLPMPGIDSGSAYRASDRHHQYPSQSLLEATVCSHNYSTASERRVANVCVPDRL